MSTYTADFLKFELKKILHNPFFWVIHFIPLFSNFSEIERFVGKGGYVYSEFVKSGILAINEEAIITTIQYTLLPTLLLTIFLFAGIIKDLSNPRYSELLLNKPVKTSRLVATKFAPMFLSFITVNFSVLFISTWLMFLHFDATFKPLYFTVHYLLYYVVPVLVWAMLVFLLKFLFEDPKIVYPVLVLLWVINTLPGKYDLDYLSFHDVYPASPFFSYGLLGNRLAYSLIFTLLAIATIKQLDVKRNNIYGASLKGLPLGLKITGNSREYRFRESKIASYITNFKINISWKGLLGIIVVAILPPVLNVLFSESIPVGSELETTGRVIRMAEVFLPFAVLLYSANSLRVEDALNINELIVSKPRGFSGIIDYKFLTLLTHGFILTVTYYVSLVTLVSAVSPSTYLKIVVPPLLFYLSLLFTLVILTQNKRVALLVSFLLWTANLLFDKSMPLFLSTFPLLPVYSFGGSSIYLDLNKLEFALISLALIAVFVVLSRMNYRKKEV